jgi:hypothetical protein
MFRKLDLFRSSGERETPALFTYVQWLRSAPFKVPNWVSRPSTEEGNRSTSRNVLFSSSQNTRRWTKYKNPVILGTSIFYTSIIKIFRRMCPHLDTNSSMQVGFLPLALCVYFVFVSEPTLGGFKKQGELYICDISVIFCGIFSDAVSICASTASDCRMISKQWTGKHFRGSGRDVIEVL